jgi:hypothetical protein
MKLETARTKHKELVAKHMRLMAKRDKIIEAMVKTEAKVTASKQAIARSQKRLDKLIAAKTYTNGPTASVLPDVLEKLVI